MMSITIIVVVVIVIFPMACTSICRFVTVIITILRIIWKIIISFFQGIDNYYSHHLNLNDHSSFAIHPYWMDHFSVNDFAKVLTSIAVVTSLTC